eukprot:11227739-Lingulodinium_polyedra.AAC.1
MERPNVHTDDLEASENNVSMPRTYSRTQTQLKSQPTARAARTGRSMSTCSGVNSSTIGPWIPQHSMCNLTENFRPPTKTWPLDITLN